MGTPLTADEVAALPVGSRVVVTWSGGNGPHTYVIGRDECGNIYAQPIDDPTGPFAWYNPISFVGRERFHTHVWLADGEGV